MENQAADQTTQTLKGPNAIPIARPSLPDLSEYVKLLEDLWKSRILSNFGTYARLWERKAQSYLGNESVRAVSSCDLGLVIALAALDLPKGSECILPSFTFNSTANCVVWNGLKPVFCDVDLATFNPDPATIERLITPNTSGVICTHVFGNPCDIDALRQIADRHGLPLIFDAAHAFGSLYQGRHVGSFGDIEIFSFSGTKVVTAAEGGLIASISPDITERVEHLRGYGFFEDYNSRYIGLNGKISELHAALGCLTIDNVEAAVARRNSLAGRYRELLGDIESISFQRIRGADRTTYKDFAIVCAERRDDLGDSLAQAGIQTKKYFRPIHQMTAFVNYGDISLPNTEWLADHVLCIPIFNDMSDDQVEQVAGAIRKVLLR